jgi:hypothetical protein
LRTFSLIYTLNNRHQEENAAPAMFASDSRALQELPEE